MTILPRRQFTSRAVAFCAWLAIAMGLHGAESVRLIRTSPSSLDQFQGSVDSASPTRMVEVPWSGQGVATVYLDGAPKRFVKWWQAVDRGRTLKVALDWVPGGELPAIMTVEAAVATRELPDGRHIFRIEDATVNEVPGGGARMHEWRFDAARPGNYFVEVTGNGWEGRTEAVDIDLGGVNRPAQLNFTDGKRRLMSKSIGVMRVPAAGPQVLKARLGEPGRPIRGTLTTVVLRPAPEGERLRPGTDQSYELKVADAALAGVDLGVSGSGENAVVPGWTDNGATLQWLCEDLLPGRYSVELVHQSDAGAVGELEIRVGSQTFRTPVVATSTGGVPERRTVGELEIRQTGDQPVTLGIRGARGTWSVSGLRLVRRGN